MIFPKPQPISFRNEVEGVDNTGYLTHSLYSYPAKFIPQIVRFCLTRYVKKGGCVLDPFAGSGTTGVEAALHGYHPYLLDINPLLDYFYPLKMPAFTQQQWECSYRQAAQHLHEILHGAPKPSGALVFCANKNLAYWYPERLYHYFCGVWERFHQLDDKDSMAKNAVALTLFKLSKQYSYAEHTMPKLFASRRKKEFIHQQLADPQLFKNIADKGLSILSAIKKSVDTLVHQPLSNIHYYGGVDAADFDFGQLPALDSIITSPPYLQAQEYLRTFKLEMMWAGMSPQTVRDYMAKEIPFRGAPARLVGAYVNRIRKQIGRADLLRLYDSYFWWTLKSLTNAASRLKKDGTLCVLIGNPKMNGVEVEIWKVIYENFVEQLNFRAVDIYEDKIVARKLFRGRNNPNPDGMKSEYLLVLQKPASNPATVITKAVNNLQRSNQQQMVLNQK